MQNIELLSYLKWSNNLIKSMIKDLTGEQINQEFDENMGSINKRLVHLAGELMGWLFDLQKKPLEEEVKKIEGLSSSGLLEYIDEFTEKWKVFSEESKGRQFEINENGVTLHLSIDELVFNVVNHSSYHRGQIVTLMRNFGVNAVMTDYFWYRIGNQNSK